MNSSGKSSNFSALLVGFVGDITGDDEARFHRPVIDYNKNMWASLANEWTSLNQFTDVRKNEGITFLPQSKMTLLPQEGVWTLGNRFAEQLTELNVEFNKDSQFSILSGDCGYYTVGTWNDFNTWNINLFSSLKKRLSDAWDDNDVVLAQRIFSALNKLHNIAPYDLAIERGSYYKKIDDETSFQYIVSDVIVDGLFDDEDSFLSAIESSQK